MKHDEATVQPAPLGQVERGVGRPVPQRHKLALECLYDDNTKTLMSKGHHAETEFMAACEVWNGGPMTGWGKVRHVWLRNTPDSTGVPGVMVMLSGTAAVLTVSAGFLRRTVVGAPTASVDGRRTTARVALPLHM